MPSQLYEWLFQMSGDEWVSDDIYLVLCNVDNEIVRYTLTMDELLGLLERPSETRDSIDSLISSYRKASLDIDDVLGSQYVELDIGE